METDKKRLIKDKYILKKIIENIKDVEGLSTLNIYNSSNICENYLDVLNKIYNIGFPTLLTMERGYKKFEYVEVLYKYLNLPFNNFVWLIPNFCSSNWWLELKVERLDEFVNFYYPNSDSINLTAIDTKNQLLFDIENGESNYEYRIIWL